MKPKIKTPAYKRARLKRNLSCSCVELDKTLAAYFVGFEFEFC